MTPSAVPEEVCPDPETLPGAAGRTESTNCCLCSPCGKSIDVAGFDSKNEDGEVSLYILCLLCTLFGASGVPAEVNDFFVNLKFSQVHVNYDGEWLLCLA